MSSNDENQNNIIDISVIIPVFNEEGNIVELYQQVSRVLEKTGKSFEIVFVNDGSTDQSSARLVRLYQEHPVTVRVIHFSRNFGHQLALSAGLNYCKGRAAIVMDADLQDPPEVMVDFIRQWEKGFAIVYGVRSKREGETFFKKFTAQVFYKLIRATTSIDIPANVGDFYLLDRKVIDMLKALKERHRFLRGLIAWTGFKSAKVYYVRRAREEGTTKYSLWKMVKFSIDAMTSFSFSPLRWVSWIGALFALAAFAYILVVFYQRLFTDTTIVGWSSLMAVILFLGGIQLLSIGIIGEYIARIGDDVKSRPLYAVKEILE